MSSRHDQVADVSAALCGALSDNGFRYTWSASGARSRYIFVTQPIAAKIRVSDHPSDRIEKDRLRSKMMVLDVGLGRHGIVWEVALAHLLDAKDAPS